MTRIRFGTRFVIPALMVAAGILGMVRLGPAQASNQQRQDPLAEPFVGITTDGEISAGLFPIRATGVSTEPMRDAANRFLEALTQEQREKTTFPVDDIEWRAWNNVHRYDRKGVSFREMNEAQRGVAFDLMRASLSVKGFETSRDIMRLNGTMAEIRDNWEEYGDDLYNLTMMGEPSATMPWGWQLDGHHLIINQMATDKPVVWQRVSGASVRPVCEPTRLCARLGAGVCFRIAQRRVPLRGEARRRRVAVRGRSYVRTVRELSAHYPHTWG